ncbi:MAG: nucleotidyltransferase family protein, partial [Gaiellaceae bacterium]
MLKPLDTVLRRPVRHASRRAAEPLPLDLIGFDAVGQAARMKALILAAGYATRLRPLTDELPKQLLRVGGRPMVDWILEKVC